MLKNAGDQLQRKGKEIDDLLDAVEEGKEPPKVKKVEKKPVSPKKIEKVKQKAKDSERDKMLDYLRKNKLNTTGNNDILAYRISAHKLKLRRKAKREARRLARLKRV